MEFLLLSYMSWMIIKRFFNKLLEEEGGEERTSEYFQYTNSYPNDFGTFGHWVFDSALPYRKKIFYVFWSYMSWMIIILDNFG